MVTLSLKFVLDANTLNDALSTAQIIKYQDIRE